MKKIFYPVCLAAIGGLLSLPVSAQEVQVLEETKPEPEEKVTLHVGADLVSRYVWRGQDYGNSPAIQPTIAVSAFGFTLGGWGSYGFSRYTYNVNDSLSIDANYAECDFYLYYTWKYFTLMVYDYYTPSPIDTMPGNNYFNWNNKTTLHTLEASLIIDGPEKFPIQFIAATLLYGADKGKDSSGIYGYGDKNNFSTYFELSYLFDIKGFSLRPFVGGIPFGSSWYGPNAGITVAGISLSKDIPVAKKFSIPVKTTFVVNHMSKKAYLVFTLTI